MIAEGLLQVINVAFLSVQLIYMQKCGYSDHTSAGYISYRFLGMLLFAVPLGLYIKGRPIKPLFLLGSIIVPAFSLMIIFSTRYHWHGLLILAQLGWGIGFTFIQIPIIPYILRNASKSHQTGAIALSYSTYSFGGIFSGLVIWGLLKYLPAWFNEETTLLLLACCGFAAIYFILKVNISEHIPVLSHKRSNLRSYNWGIILKALTPTLIIAVGAGLTIPFIGLFFFNIHHFSTDYFSFFNTIASLLVALSAMLVPYIKHHLGYKIAIPTSQSFAVLALVLLATTEFYAHLWIAPWIAVFCFLLRQPLMNMAGPMTTELVMSYVGSRNQEMVSGLTAAIWSGSWFISSLIFKFLRQSAIPYVYIFMITAALYGVGVIWYYALILDFNKRLAKGEIKSEIES